MLAIGRELMMMNFWSSANHALSLYHSSFWLFVALSYGSRLTTFELFV